MSETILEVLTGEIREHLAVDDSIAGEIARGLLASRAIAVIRAEAIREAANSPEVAGTEGGAQFQAALLSRADRIHPPLDLQTIVVDGVSVKIAPSFDTRDDSTDMRSIRALIANACTGTRGEDGTYDHDPDVAPCPVHPAPPTHTGDESCPICYAERTAEPGEALPEIVCYGPDATPIPDEYADDPDWEYGFRMDGRPEVWARVFGLRITSAAAARHAAAKSYRDWYELVRHPKGSDRDDDWEAVE